MSKDSESSFRFVSDSLISFKCSGWCFRMWYAIPWCFRSKKELLNIAGNWLVSSQLFFHCHQCENRKIANIYFLLLDEMLLFTRIAPEVQSTSVSFAKGFSNGWSSELILARNLKCEVRSMGYKIQFPKSGHIYYSVRINTSNVIKSSQ